MILKQAMYTAKQQSHDASVLCKSNYFIIGICLWQIKIARTIYQYKIYYKNFLTQKNIPLKVRIKEYGNIVTLFNILSIKYIKYVTNQKSNINLTIQLSKLPLFSLHTTHTTVPEKSRDRQGTRQEDTKRQSEHKQQL